MSETNQTNGAVSGSTTVTDKRWLAMIVICLGALMIVLDATIVNVALPSIREDLGFSEASLAWVVNAYMLTFGGFLLLSGRLGDLFGQRRVFLFGIALFTLASLACGVADSQAFLIAARALQGLGGAVVSALALSLLMSLFVQPHERAKAMGVYGFVAAGGGSMGVLLGGLITQGLHWHWIFLVNIPVGIAVFVLCRALLPPAGKRASAAHLDVAGAVMVTTSLVLAVYAVVNGSEHGWLASGTPALMGAAVALFVVFIAIESRARSPLVPLALLGTRNLSLGLVIGILWSAGMFSWFFLSALYMQLVLGYSPMQVGLAFLPSNLIMATLSIGFSAKLVMRFGICPTLTAGLLLGAVGLLLFARAPIDGSFLPDVLPSMVLLGLAAGLMFNPLLLSAMHDIAPADAGLASGILNTAFVMGGSLGLAVLASLAAFRSKTLVAAGTAAAGALTGGYHFAFVLGTISVSIAAVLAAVFLRNTAVAPATQPAPTAHP